jgi:tripeptidyl-peptidase-1
MFKFLAVALVAAVASASPLHAAGQTRMVLEADQMRLPMNAGWAREAVQSLAAADLDEKINVIFAVRNRNVQALTAEFHQISDPQHPNYAKYHTVDSLRELYGPPDAHVDRVLDHLREHGVTGTVARSRDFISARMSRSVAATMFAAEWVSYRHSTGRRALAILGTYSLPRAVAAVVDFVSGLRGLPDIHNKPYPHRATSSPSAQETPISPDSLRAAYQVGSYMASNAATKHAVAEFQAQFYSPSDLKQFFTQFVKDHQSCTQVTVQGDNTPNEPGAEASLDIQYIMGVAPCVNTTFYSNANFNFFSDITEWVNKLVNEQDTPQVQSISYGLQAPGQPSKSYRERVDAEFQKLGMRGVSVIFASGDDGSACRSVPQHASCPCGLFSSWPAASEYITSVGSLHFLSGNSGQEASTVAFGSGGGFSDFFPTGTFQKAAVAAYLSKGTQPHACLFNKDGRGTPDVSAAGSIEYQVIIDGQVNLIGGTSASTPTFSAIVSLLNDVQLNAGKKTLGFLGPWLYQNPSMLTDITLGNNLTPCPGGSGPCLGNSGWETATGWDASSGLGSPNFEKMKAALP